MDNSGDRPDAVTLVIENGWLLGVKHLKSPHCEPRPPGGQLSLMVVHGISLPPGEFGSQWIDDLFLGRLDPVAHPYFKEIAALKVSAHCLIRRSGEIVQYVSFDEQAWHAGKSEYCGQAGCNRFSVGIELEGTDELPYTDIQYVQLTALCQVLVAHYPDLSVEHVVGHCHIAPGRKTDPGPSFDWLRFRSGLSAE